jgi:hypothetical protein
MLDLIEGLGCSSITMQGREPLSPFEAERASKREALRVIFVVDSPPEGMVRRSYLGSGSVMFEPVDIYYHPGPPATFDVSVKREGQHSFPAPKRFVDARQLVKYLEEIGVQIGDARRFLSQFQDQPRWERLERH